MWNLVIVNRDGTVCSVNLPTYESASAAFDAATQRATTLYAHFGALLAIGEIERMNHFTRD